MSRLNPMKAFTRLRRPVIVAAVVLAATSACTTGKTTAAQSGTASEASQGGPAASGTGSSPSATGTAAQSGTSPSPDTTPPTAAPTSPTGCASGHIEVAYRMGGAPTGEICVHGGATIGITLQGAPGFVWTPVASSASRVVAASARTTDGGAAASAALGRALAPGTAELSSTASFTGDPHGPPTIRWTLTIRVVP